MTFHNRTLIEKADLALQDLLTGGGYLQPEQSLRFMRQLVKASVLLKQVTVRPMKAPQTSISKIKLARRVLRRGQEATALTPAQRVKPDFGSVDLEAKLFKAEVHLDDEVLEDNIEGGDLKTTVVDLLADGISSDMEELAIRGDTNSADPLLSSMDGILKQTTSHVVDAAGAPISKDLLDDTLRALPSEYRTDKTKLRYLCSVDTEQDYRAQLAERATGVGDKFLEEAPPVLYSGVPLSPVPLWPEDEGAANDSRTSMVLMDPKNVIVGIWRQVRVETDRDISAGVLRVVATLRFDVRLMEELATARLSNLRAA